MLAYYIELAVNSLFRARIMTGLMVLAIGLGIGASMTMITVLHVMSGDPLPGRSARLYVPMLDPRPSSQESAEGNSTPDGFTWVDATNLMSAKRADRQAAMSSGYAAVRPERDDLHPFFETGEYVTSDFFRMFNAQFLMGTGWTAVQDGERAHVVVLNASLDRKLFGDAGGVGKTVHLNNVDFLVIGVLDDWRPQPKFYAQKNGHIFGESDQFFLPLQTALDLNFGFNGRLSCWGSDSDNKRQSDKCTWVQFWVELDSPTKVSSYRRFLVNYWRDQQTSERFPRNNAPPHLYGLMEWLTHEQVIPSNVSMQLWLAVGFQFVCMLSVVALLLAKFLRRSGEISIRRALGARRRDIFIQFGVESVLIGGFGGVLGLAVAQFGLWIVRQRPDGYARLAQMDVQMLISAMVLAIVASVLAGLLPAWRACNVPPALRLKEQ